MKKTVLLRGSFVLVFSLFISLLPASSFGEILTVKHTVKQTFGGGQSPDDARIFAIAKAKREALEKAGTYIESLTVVKNTKLEKDEILALTAGVLKAEVVSQKSYASDDVVVMEIIVNVIVDTSVLEEKVKKQLQDRTHLTELKEIQKREKELLQKVAQLEEENRKLSANNQSTEKIKKGFQQASEGLTAVDCLYKAYALWDGQKVTDPQKAIEYLNNAIKLQPDYARAYSSRGLSYYYLGQYQQAIKDCNEAIRLKPDLSNAYNNRGMVYGKLGQYQLSIEDFNKAIRLKPDDAVPYYNRGLSYYYIGKYQLAIEDYNEAIHLKLSYANAYFGRGTSYLNLEQHQRAIEDFNEVIRLKPDYAAAYNNRGTAYITQGNSTQGCLDAQKACALGDCKLLEHVKGKDLCH